MSRSHYGSFREGVQISGVNMNLHQKGKVFYVCNSSVPGPNSSVGSDSANGTTTNYPLATIAKAFSLCIANRGDKIVILPGHAETVSTTSGAAWNVAGVEVIGVGVGSQRPTFTLNTATTSTINVSAANIKVTNVLFVANFAAVASCFTLTTATDFQINQCEFRDTSSALNFVSIVTTDTTSNHADGLSIYDSVVNGLGTTAGTTVVSMKGTNDRVNIVNNNVYSAANVAAILATIATGKIMTHATVSDNTVQSAYTGSAGCLMTTNGSTNTGAVARNQVSITGGGTDLLVTASSGFSFNQNYLGDASGSGVLKP